MITEVEVEGIGMVRLPNDWQWERIKRVRGPNQRIAQFAAAACMSIKQFKRLPADKQREIVEAYLALTDPANMEGLADREDTPPRFTKGIHRTDEEKIAIGRQLLKVKASLPRGHFGPWLEDQGIPKGFAHSCLRLAREADTSRLADAAQSAIANP